MYAHSADRYQHTQRGPWSLILLAFGVGLCAIAVAVRNQPVAVAVCASAGALLILLAASFHELTVADEGDHLAVRFGPLPLAQTRIPYADITNVEVGRTLFLDGWGVHMSLRGGWVWNISGRDCVVIQRTRGVIRVGTDEPDALAELLRRKIMPLRRA